MLFIRSIVVSSLYLASGIRYVSSSGHEKGLESEGAVIKEDVGEVLEEERYG